jgi:hypothetical protein
VIREKRRRRVCRGEEAREEARRRELGAQAAYKMQNQQGYGYHPQQPHWTPMIADAPVEDLPGETPEVIDAAPPLSKRI